MSLRKGRRDEQLNPIKIEIGPDLYVQFSNYIGVNKNKDGKEEKDNSIYTTSYIYLKKTNTGVDKNKTFKIAVPLSCFWALKQSLQIGYEQNKKIFDSFK